MSQTTAFPLEARTEAWTHLARAVLFVVVWSLVWITLDPFGSLGADDQPTATSGNDVWSYVSFGLLAAMVVCATIGRRRQFQAAVSDWMFLTLAIYASYTVVASADPNASMKRYLLFLIVAVIAALVGVLPKNRDEFTRLILGVAWVVVALSYLGVLLLPDLAIHQATDAIEARLAGDWRGIFPHKNLAGGVFATMIFIGIFAARAGHLGSGLGLIAASALFVVLSGAKSSLIILPLTLIVSGICTGIRSTFLRAVVVALPLAFLLAIGVGSVLSPAIGAMVHALPFDTSFTGRTDIWTFALEHLAQRPLTGHGFMAFWALENTRLEVDSNESWAGSASNAHNGFLDTALNIGLIGLALTVIVLVVNPFLNHAKARRQGSDPALTTLFFQLWLFCIYLSCMESFLFIRANQMWFTLLVAVFGLRMMARFRVTKPASEPRRAL